MRKLRFSMKIHMNSCLSRTKETFTWIVNKWLCSTYLLFWYFLILINKWELFFRQTTQAHSSKRWSKRIARMATQYGIKSIYHFYPDFRIHHYSIHLSSKSRQSTQKTTRTWWMRQSWNSQRQQSSQSQRGERITGILMYAILFVCCFRARQATILTGLRCQRCT